MIIRLSATDKDGPANGPPFIFELSQDADNDIRSRFEIRGKRINVGRNLPTVLRAYDTRVFCVRFSDGNLYATVVFDREEQKEYDIRIKITDSGTPAQSGVDVLKVVIGDENDNAMKEGFSSIFVYLFEVSKERGVNCKLETIRCRECLEFLKSLRAVAGCCYRYGNWASVRRRSGRLGLGRQEFRMDAIRRLFFVESEYRHDYHESRLT